MKEIGIIEDCYHVMQSSPRKFVIEFQLEDYRLSIEKLEINERMSEETMCFSADLVLNGKVIGICSNRGHGGYAEFHLYEYNADFNELTYKVRNVPDYCFPRQTLIIYGVIDALACFTATFKDNDVKTITKAKAVMNILNKEANKYREQFA